MERDSLSGRERLSGCGALTILVPKPLFSEALVESEERWDGELAMLYMVDVMEQSVRKGPDGGKLARKQSFISGLGDWESLT